MVSVIFRTQMHCILRFRSVVGQCRTRNTTESTTHIYRNISHHWQKEIRNYYYFHFHLSETMTPSASTSVIVTLISSLSKMHYLICYSNFWCTWLKENLKIKIATIVGDVPLCKFSCQVFFALGWFVLCKNLQTTTFLKNLFYKIYSPLQKVEATRTPCH